MKDANNRIATLLTNKRGFEVANSVECVVLLLPMNVNETDSYSTIAETLRAPELKERSSRFIADVFAVDSKEMVDRSLDAIRKEFYDASHHCYAYRLGVNGEITRAADDGEPSGTAGKPILQALTASGLTNILCIVTRYFGGTKLGTGGLVRAYGEAAASAISLANRREIILTSPLLLECSYETLPQLERFLATKEIAARKTDYAEGITCTLEIRRSLIDSIRHDIAEVFYGQVTIRSDDELTGGQTHS